MTIFYPRSFTSGESKCTGQYKISMIFISNHSNTHIRAPLHTFCMFDVTIIDYNHFSALTMYLAVTIYTRIQSNSLALISRFVWCHSLFFQVQRYYFQIVQCLLGAPFVINKVYYGIIFQINRQSCDINIYLISFNKHNFHVFSSHTISSV